METCFAESDAAAIKHTVTRIEKTIGVVKTYLQLKAVTATKQMASAWERPAPPKTKTGAKARTFYKKHLGLELKDFGGAVLRWPEDGAEDHGVTAWHVAGPKSKWFSPGESSFMINYRVDNMEEMLK